MIVTLTVANALVRILKLIESVPPSDQPWLKTNLIRALTGTDAPPEPVQNGANEPKMHQVQTQFEQVVVSRFLEFWTAYPRKVGRLDALRIYKRIRPGKEMQEQILKAVHEQKASEQWQKEKGQFIPLPKTWLNRGSWTDDLHQVHAPVQKAPNLNHFTGCECRQCK